MPLVAGSINLGAPVTMRVERVGADTRHEAIVAMMRDAHEPEARAGTRGRPLGRPFLWAVLGLATLAALVWSVIDPSRAVWVAVSVLIVTCPCALSLAAPATLVAAAGGLARRGVMVQRLDALESMARLDRLFIDKTGTLTTQALQLQQVRIVSANRVAAHAGRCAGAGGIAGSVVAASAVASAGGGRRAGGSTAVDPSRGNRGPWRAGSRCTRQDLAPRRAGLGLHTRARAGGGA